MLKVAIKRKGRRRKVVLKEKVEVKEREKMADKVSEEGGNSGDDGKRDDNKSTDKGLEEEVGRRLRSATRKIGEGKEYMKEAAGMKNFLEKGKLKGEESGIAKGKELERTPIKKSGVDKEGKGMINEVEIGNGGGAEKESQTNEEKGREREEQKKKEEGEAAEEKREGKIEAGEKVSAGVMKWMEKMSERVSELENKLNREKESRKEMKGLMGELWERNKIDRVEMGKMRDIISEMAVRAENDKRKINELELIVLRWEKESEGNGENSGGEMERGGSDRESEVTQENGENVNNIDTGGGQGKSGLWMQKQNSEQDEVKETSADIERLIESREYLSKMPEAMSENEWDWELKERKSRKKNIIVKGVRAVGKGIKEEIKEIVRKFMNRDIYIEKIRVIGGGVLVELQSMENKIELMKRKGLLKGIGIWIEDDHTVREKQVQEWLERLKEEEKRRGHEIRVGYQKIMVDGEWYEWREKEGKLGQVSKERGKGGKEV